ncbi:MAG: DUF6069 family protein [Actinomycetes bacterium]
MTTITSETTPADVGGRSALRHLLLAAAASVAANLLIFGIASVADVDLLVPESPGSDATIELTMGTVVAATVLPLTIALVVALVLRRTRRGGRQFTALVVAGLVLSFGPLFGAGMDTGTMIALGLMHPVVAAAALWQLRPVAASPTTRDAAAHGTGS